ncbi:Na+/H+ antiporter subunit A [Marinicrinis lubricantis]|uniref:Na+/H+ antiporter subunit A n=1 Tax=Marinicrinis lubricantis TaxID=2086470 RepID=A0ABW1IJR5_9BACL
MSLLHFLILLPLLAAILVPFLRKAASKIHTGWFVLAIPAVLFIYFVSKIPQVQDGEYLLETMSWIPSLDLNFTVYLDGLGILFALLISGIGTLVVLYSIYYLDKQKEAIHQFYVYLLMFMAAMLGVTLSDNLIVLYGFWELTSISSFLLIGFWNHRDRSRYGAQKSMLITVFGGFAMLAGFILMYLMTGSFSVREIIADLNVVQNHSLFLPAMILVLLGAFTKSAQFPFHIWLPDAMEAPTPVSAYLHSATMVKAGIYLVARLSPVFAGNAEWFWIVSSVGLITLCWGSFFAVKQTDLKGILAYSTISQLGMIMSLLGLGSAAVYYGAGSQSDYYIKATTAAVFHLINHATFKGALFMVAGIVDHETGTRDIRRLGGLMTLMPISFTLMLIGTFSMAGLPPFNGFLSKEMFFTAMVNAAEMNFFNMETWGVLFPVLAWLASVFTFIYSMILLFKTFRGSLKLEQLPKKPHEAPLGMLLSPMILASLVVIFGLFPNILSYSLIEPAMASILPSLLQPGDQFLVHISHWHGWQTEIFMTIGVIVFGTLLFLSLRYLQRIYRWIPEKLSLNLLYDKGLSAVDQGSNRLTRFYMRGSVRQYLIYIFAFMIVMLCYSLIRFDAMVWTGAEYADMSIYEIVLVIILVASAAAVPFSQSRLTSIILVGAVGYIVTLFFVIFRAPDLALTQMVVETVSVALFLLCFYHLPKLKKELTSIKFKLSNFVISLGVGITMTLISISVTNQRLFESISDFFLEESYRLAGGKNVVNVILVDFRGFDTLLEIMVLGVASLGIYTMIRLRLEETKREDKEKAYTPEYVFPSFGWMRSNDVILQTVTKVVVFIILAFSVFIFLAGHNHPGGGFIGGLITSSALVLLALAFDLKTIRNVIPADFRRITAAGLLIAVLTGIGSFVFDAPFLSHTFGYFDLPLLGKTELATATIFDLGVYLAVVGVTMTIILTIGEDR